MKISGISSIAIAPIDFESKVNILPTIEQTIKVFDTSGAEELSFSFSDPGVNLKQMRVWLGNDFNKDLSKVYPIKVRNKAFARPVYLRVKCPVSAQPSVLAGWKKILEQYSERIIRRAKV